MASDTSFHGAIIGAAVSAVLPVAFAFARRYFPAPEVGHYPPATRDALQPLYGRYQALESTLCLLLAPIFTFACYRSLRALNLALGPQPQPGDVVFRSGTAVSLLPSLFIGILLATLFASLALRCVLAGRFPQYQLFVSLQWAFDHRRLERWCLALLAVVLPLAVFASLNGAVRVTHDGIEIRRPLATHTVVYPYRSVTSVTAVRGFRAPSGSVVERPRYIVRFADGADWSTEDLLPDADPERDAKAANLVSSRSGKPIGQEAFSDRE